MSAPRSPREMVLGFSQLTLLGEGDGRVSLAPPSGEG